MLFEIHKKMKSSYQQKSIIKIDKIEIILLKDIINYTGNLLRITRL